MMKKLILVSALLGSMLIAGAAELIHLKMDFSRPGWNEILSPQGGETTVRDGELSLSAGSSVVTPYFPLTPGELEVRGIAAGNLTLRIHFLRGGNHRDPGTEVGIRFRSDGKGRKLPLPHSRRRFSRRERRLPARDFRRPREESTPESIGNKTGGRGRNHDQRRPVFSK